MKEKIVVGIDVGGTFIKAALINRRGLILDWERKPTEAARGRKRVGENIFSSLQALEARLPARKEIAAIGLGVPGVIDFDCGVITASPNIPGWQNLSIQEIFSPKIPWPLSLENDANAAALGEKWVGAAIHSKNFCFLTLGTGVGGGLVLGGEIWHGADGMAGEVGHMTIDPSGPRCGCGNRGCLEMYASAKALARMVMEERSIGKNRRFGKEANPKDVTGKAIHQAAMKGDPVARRAFASMGTALGIGIADLINLLNPERIVLGGALAAAWKYFIPSVREEIQYRAFRVPARRAKIVRAAVGERAGVLGAAFLAWKSLGVHPRPHPSL